MTLIKKTQGNHSLLKVDSTLVSLHGYPQFFINVQPGLQITPQGDVSTIAGSALGFKVGDGSFAQYSFSFWLRNRCRGKIYAWQIYSQ